jgi:hypothetical protein
MTSTNHCESNRAVEQPQQPQPTLHSLSSLFLFSLLQISHKSVFLPDELTILSFSLSLPHPHQQGPHSECEKTLVVSTPSLHTPSNPSSSHHNSQPSPKNPPHCLRPTLHPKRPLLSVLLRLLLLLLLLSSSRLRLRFNSSIDRRHPGDIQQVPPQHPHRRQAMRGGFE